MEETEDYLDWDLCAATRCSKPLDAIICAAPFCDRHVQLIHGRVREEVSADLFEAARFFAKRKWKKELVRVKK